MSCGSRRGRRISKGVGQITMRDLVKNCLRMRPERIIVGEVRGPEAFDLLQAMNTGHDGSMGTLHANSPREALSRIESMITMGGYALPTKTIREMITSSVDVIIQAARLRDGSRRITHITEVVGHGRRRRHHPGPVRLRHPRRGRAGQADRAGIARPASAGRASGSARASTARRSASRRRSTSRKSASEAQSSREQRVVGMVNPIAVAGLAGGWRSAAWRSPSSAAIRARTSAARRSREPTRRR